MNRWTLEVEDFGKISHAKVEVAPLTLFMGENNSGKSYLMTLIYGILTLDSFFYLNTCNKSEEYKQCYKIVQNIFHRLEDEETLEYTISIQEMKGFESLFNQILNGPFLLKNIFNKVIEMGSCHLSFDESIVYSYTFQYQVQGEDRRIDVYGNQGNVCPAFVHKKGEFGESQIAYMMSYLLDRFVQRDFIKNSLNDAIYLPASRTGFMLTYKSVVGSALQDKFNLDGGGKNLLTKPVGDFITRLSTLSLGHDVKNKSLVECIEKHLVKGHVELLDTPSQDIAYHPDEVEQAIPMYLASGVVTEISPLLLFLQHEVLKTIIIEEPEISLHPELQLRMARLLVRMSNGGIPTFVTTHSDLIVQYINNMIRLSGLKDSGKMVLEDKYDEEDMLKRENVVAYEFNVGKDGKTVVSPVPCGDYGFEANTFYKTLNELSEEIDEIEERMEE